MAEPNAQQLARQRLAAVDIAQFAPPTPKRKNPELCRSNSLQWYYDHKEYCNAKNKEWRESHKEQKLESHRKWMAKHPGYYTKEQKQKRKEKRENGERV